MNDITNSILEKKYLDILKDFNQCKTSLDISELRNQRLFSELSYAKRTMKENLEDKENKDKEKSSDDNAKLNDLMIIISSKENERVALMNIIQNLTDDKNMILDQSVEDEMTIRNLSEQVEEFQKIIEVSQQIQMQNDRLKLDLKQYQTKENGNHLEQENDKVKSLEENCENLNAIISDLNNQLASEREKYVSIARSDEKWRKECANLEENIGLIKEKNRTLSCRLRSDAMNTLSRSSVNLHDSDNQFNEIRALKDKMNLLLNTIASYEENMDYLCKKYKCVAHELAEELDTKVVLNNELSELRLKNKIEQLKSGAMIEEMCDLQNELDSSIIDQKSVICSMKKQIGDLESQLLHQSEDAEMNERKLNSKIIILNENEEYLEEKLVKFKSQLKLSQEEKLKLEIRLQQILDEEDDKEDLIQQMDELFHQISLERKLNEKMTNAIKILEEKRKSDNEMYYILYAQNEKNKMASKSQLYDLNVTIEQLNEKIVALNEAENGLTNNIKDVKEELDECQDINEKLELNYDELSQKLTAMTHELEKEQNEKLCISQEKIYFENKFELSEAVLIQEETMKIKLIESLTNDIEKQKQKVAEFQQAANLMEKDKNSFNRQIRQMVKEIKEKDYQIEFHKCAEEMTKKEIAKHSKTIEKLNIEIKSYQVAMIDD